MCGVVQSFCCGTTLTESSSIRVFIRILYDLLGPTILEPLLDKDLLTAIYAKEDQEEQEALGEYRDPKQILTTNNSNHSSNTSSSSSSTKSNNSNNNDEKKGYVFIMIDGGFLNKKTRYPEKVLQSVRHLKRRGEFDPFISCNLQGSILSIRLMSGRNVRALLYLKKALTLFEKTKHLIQKPGEEEDTTRWSYSDMMQGEIIDFTDAIEEKSLVIAQNPEDFAGNDLRVTD